MNKNLPKEYKDANIFKKIFGKIKLLLFGKKQALQDEQVMENVEIKEKLDGKKEIKSVEKTQDSYNNTQEYSGNREVEQRIFMENLTEHPELLEKFSNDRLGRILQYYIDENERKRKKLKKLRQNS